MRRTSVAINRANCDVSIYERLREVRSKLGLSQTEASTKFCIGLSSYKKYEAGSSEPGSSALAGISNAGVNTNWLLTGKGPMLVADYDTKPAAEPVAPATIIAESVIDVERLQRAIEEIDIELIKRRRTQIPIDSRARLIVMGYQVLEDEDKEKDRVSFEYAQKAIHKLMKSII